jgi:EAL domain-containing protein (putative c-di-GMP-specific phosphodiesterase class I)
MAGKRLLVMDDDPAFARLVQRVAEPLGYDAVAAADAAGFRDVVGRGELSAIILDLNMPGVDGIELLRELSQARCTIPVLLSSGVEGKVLDAAHRLGIEYGLPMAGTLPKPLRVKDLRAALDHLPGSKPKLAAEDLAQGLDDDQVVVDYQPKLDLRTQRVAGVEALVRWHHPEMGILAPDKFLALAESGGLMARLTDRVIALSLAQIGSWRRSGLDIGVAINLSATVLEDTALPDRIARLCEQSEIPPNLVTLELTETASSQEPVKMMDTLTRFRLKGFHLSIDDFGTGYSSLAQLQRLPFSEMKIDKSFVMRMAKVEDCRVIANAVIDLAHNLSLAAVAEGVETKEVLRLLTERGCDLAQGYYISRPLTPEGVPDFVRLRNLAL